MKTAFFYLSILILSGFYACINDEPKPESPDVVALRVPYDSLLVDSESGLISLEVFGLVVKPDSGTRVNNGYLAKKSESYFDLDSSEVILERKTISWSSSNESVVRNQKGQLEIRNTGTAEVTAVYKGTTSNTIHINITPNPSYVAPWLILDEPQTILTISDKYVITGKVEYGANLSANGELISYNSKGDFSYVGSGIPQGESLVTLTATHAQNDALKTNAEKKVIFLSPSQLASIVGPWLGTTNGIPFNFDISYQSNSQTYTIKGLIDLEFAGYGSVKNVVISGIINAFGEVDATLSKSTSNFFLSGKLDGKFESLGIALGTYNVKISEGFISFTLVNEDWSAVKQ